MSRTGIVNVRMVITEEKILSNIDKVQKLINPNSKKQIVQLDEDTYFKDLIESIKTYLIEYPKKKNFPKNVYKATYGLVEYATNQFEENTKQIEELIRQREKNIMLSGNLRNLLEDVQNKEVDWKENVKEAEKNFGEDIIDTLGIIGRSKSDASQNYQDAVKLINARIVNLESNLHIEIDMERIEDRSKALSYIGIEVADALKVIPAPADYETENIEIEQTANVTNNVITPVNNSVLNTSTATTATVAIANDVTELSETQDTYMADTRVDVKPSLWQKIKNSKIGRAVSCIFRIKIVLDVPTLPEGRGE